MQEVPEWEAVRNRLVGRCVNGVAHELNNTLGSILNFAELIEIEEDTTEGCRERLREIRAATGQAADLLEAVLISARPTKARVRVFALPPLLEQALMLYTFALQRAQVNVQCEVLAAESPTVLADRSKIMLIFLSLLDCVVRHDGERPRTVSFRIREDNGTICVSVTPFGDEWPASVPDREENAVLAEFLSEMNIEVDQTRSTELRLRFSKSENP